MSIGPISKNIGIADALQSLRPGAVWVMSNEEYSELEWQDEYQSKPTETDVIGEIEKLQKDSDDTEYQRWRIREYPPMQDYLDGIVKNDTAQIQKYIDECLAVKEKYPKPEDVTS